MSSTLVMKDLRLFTWSGRLDDDPTVKVQAVVKISCIEHNLIIAVSNIGKTLDKTEQENLFQPFMRGKNSNGTIGFGLGLRIVQRILLLHNAKIVYSVLTKNTNVFQLIFNF